MRSFGSIIGFWGAAFFASTVATIASAQPAPDRTKPATTPAPAPAPDRTKPATTPAPPAAAAPDPAAAPNVIDTMAAVPGGITVDQVAQRAAQTSYQAKAAEQTADAAEARADQAYVNFLPRVGLLGRYTRLSELTPPSITFGGTSIPGFPLVFNQWLAQATINVPISDYFFKINQQYTAATRQQEAARYDVLTAKAKSFSDGKLAYFAWLRARGGVTVAQQSLAVARAHQKDAENQFAVGNASKADVLRATTSVASSELALEKAKSNVVVTQTQVRIAIHGKEDEKLEPGDSLDGSLPQVAPSLQTLIAEAESNRPEIKSVDKNAESARKLGDVQRGNRYPVLSAFGEVSYGNPNARRFPATQDWFATWSAGAQITWSPNDLIGAGSGVAEAEARAAALEAQKQATRDGIDLEVTQAYQAVVEADTAIGTTTRQLDSALEGYRVARELFNAGRGTSTTLIDAENALAQARFDHLNARVDARTARVRLEHAIGRDVRNIAPNGQP